MRAALIAVLLAACGGGAHDHPGGLPDAVPDAAPPCDFTEAADAQNSGDPEATAVTLGDAATRNLCGAIDHGHYDSATRTIDVDRYRVTVDAPSVDLLVQLFAGADADGLDELSVLIFDTGAVPALINGGSRAAALGDHGVFRSTLASGTYDIVVRARANADVAAAIAYKVRFSVDHPCPALTDPAAYVEAHDGANDRGNDVVAVDFSANPPFTMLVPPGTAEPTNLTVDPDARVRISGSSAAVTGADQYLDRDTFQVATGAATNELSVRLAGPPGADLDYLVFEAGTTVATASSTHSTGDGSELATFAVKPGTSYWLWIGAAAGSTGLPAMYDASVCGAQAVN